MNPVYAPAPPPTVNAADANRARATAMRRARRIRARSLRRRVVAGALALFVAAWLMITIALVTGHDPALAAKKTTTVASSPASTTVSTSTSTGSTAVPTSSVSTHQS